MFLRARRDIFGPKQRERRRKELLKDTQMGNRRIFFPMYIEDLNLNIMLSKDLLCALGPWWVSDGVYHVCGFIFPKKSKKALIQSYCWLVGFEILESCLWDGRTTVHPAASITYLHGKVGDEGCSRDLHLKHTFACLRSAVHHCARHRGERIARDDCGFHSEFGHPRPGFL